MNVSEKKPDQIDFVVLVKKSRKLQKNPKLKIKLH